MLINLSELFSSDGIERIYTCDFEADVFHAPAGDYAVVSKEPVSLHIRSLGDRKFLVEGIARIFLGIPCDRCLEPVVTAFKLDIRDELDMGKSEEERAEDLDEQPYVSGYNLDVDQLLCNELLLNLPMKVLCKEDCKGICNRCGTNLNSGSCSCDQSSPDPRMAAFQDLFQQFKEV